MSRIWFLAGLCLFLGSGSATAQVVSLDNRTGLKFSKVMVYRERDADRHTFEYDPQYRYGGRGYTTPALKPDTVSYAFRIRLAQSGTYTFKFEGAGDTLCYLFGVAVGNKTAVTLDSNILVYSRKAKKPVTLPNGTELIWMDKASDDGMILAEEEGRIDLFFNFVNDSHYTIYAIYPWISDEDQQRGTILYNDPDRKLMPNEHRKIAVIVDRTGDSYSNQRISFKICAVDSHSRLVTFRVKDIDLGVDDVVITDRTIAKEPQ